MMGESWYSGGNRVRLFTLYLAVSTQLILCSQTAPYYTTSARTAALSNELGLRLYKLMSQNQKGNIVISPLGMTLGLGAARLAAQANMTKDMDRIMEWNPRTIHRQLKSLRHRVTIARNDKVHFEVRNLLLGDKEHLNCFRAKFRKVIMYYSAKTKFMKSPQILNYFKKLCHNKSDIWRTLVERNTKTVFVTKVKLDAHWEVPFYVFKTSSFNIPRHDGSPEKTVQTRYMGFISDENTWNYYNDEGNKCQVIELNYGKDHVGDVWDPRYNPADISMVIVLPHNGNPLYILEEDLTVQKIDNWLSKMTPTNVDVSIPKFNLSRVIDVATLFTKLTIKNLSNDTKASNYGAISNVWQEAYLAVSETGTSSEYPLDVLSIALLSKPKKTFYAERPFLFLVRDKVKGAILFLGRVVNPNIDH